MRTNYFDNATLNWTKEQHWKELIHHTAIAARLDREESGRLENSLAAELIAATAFLSGCRHPHRIAVAHLTTFIATIRCDELYQHQTGESLYSRLEAVAYFPGGDPQIINAGMLLLELLSLNDHKEDLADDILHGRQNPLILEQDHRAEKKRLMAAWQTVPPPIQEIFKELYSRTITALFWV